MSWLLPLTLLLAPAYVVRFNLFGLPTNLLMVWVVFVWIVFWGYLIKNKLLGDYQKFKEKINKKFLLLVGLFTLAGIVSLCIHGIDRAKVGQFIVLLLQPISLYFISGYMFEKFPNAKNYFLITIYLLLALAGLLALLQYFTLFGLPQTYWGNSVEPKRAVAFFIHPNFYALFVAPLLALLLPDLSQAVNRKLLIVNCFKISAWIIGAIGLLLSLSRAGWLGLAVAAAIYLFIAADKKLRAAASVIVIVIVIVISLTPNLRYRFLLPFHGEKSAVSRLSLWHTGWKGIKENPITGLGLNGFSNNWQRLNTDPNLDTHNFPHNIFLDFWVETGVVGLIGIIGIIGMFIYRGLRNKEDIYKLSVALFLIALVVQGLIDNPYFKNDLALVFWIILAL